MYVTIEIPHPCKPWLDTSAEVDIDPFMEEATDHFLGDTDECDVRLMEDVAVWLAEPEDPEPWIAHGGMHIGWNDRSLALAKLLRANDADFRKWREAKWASRIHNRAVELAEKDYFATENCSD